jgi:hypothetical protein
MAKGFRKFTTVEMIAAAELLKLHAINVDGKVAYEDGWDDARIAAEAAPGYPGNALTAVGRIRLKMGLGKLKCGPVTPETPENPLADMQAQIDALRARVGQLEAQLQNHCHKDFHNGLGQLGTTLLANARA